MQLSKLLQLPLPPQRKDKKLLMPEPLPPLPPQKQLTMQVKQLLPRVKLPHKQLQMELMQLALQDITLYRKVLQPLLLQVSN